MFSCIYLLISILLLVLFIFDSKYIKINIYFVNFYISFEYYNLHRKNLILSFMRQATNHDDRECIIVFQIYMFWVWWKGFDSNVVSCTTEGSILLVLMGREINFRLYLWYFGKRFEGWPFDFQIYTEFLEFHNPFYVFRLLMSVFLYKHK